MIFIIIIVHYKEKLLNLFTQNLDIFTKFNEKFILKTFMIIYKIMLYIY